MEKKTITVAVFGSPNCGKSTFANSILNTDVCLTSKRPHTTREPTLAIYTNKEIQIIFIDTPGISVSQKKTESYLSFLAKKNTEEADLCLFMFDITKRIPIHILNFAESISTPKIAFINKIDATSKGKLLPYTNTLKDTFSDIFYGSAIKNEGLQMILDYIISKANIGDWQFDEKIKTTKDINQLLNDRTKEILFDIMSDEIPYNCEVETFDIEEKDNHSIVVHQNIIIKKSYKHIFLGHIKTISMKARYKIEKMLKKKVHLFINIKCAK